MAMQPGLLGLDVAGLLGGVVGNVGPGGAKGGLLGTLLGGPGSGGLVGSLLSGPKIQPSQVVVVSKEN